MKADPAAQQQLLAVQGLDARADQLRHQRSHLAELSVLADLERRRADVDGRRRDQQMTVDDLVAVQRKADADVEHVRTRRERDQQRMASGQVANPKDLERMQHELASLDRRIAVLEDEELEVMQQVEDAQATLEQLTAELAEIDEQLTGLRVTVADKQGALTAELDDVLASRGPAAEGLPADLVALYERLREAKGGVGAAELRARACGGCRLTLDNAVLQEIRTAPDDEVVRCEECQRILVRTAESGL